MSDKELGDLPSIPRARLDRLFRTAERVWEEREDVRAEYQDVRSLEFWYWFMWHGARDYERVRADLYPSPPENLMLRVVGNTDREAYRHSGLVNWRRVAGCLEEAGLDLSVGRLKDRARGRAKVLDFGCGCGRILQFFARYAQSCSFSGADVDEQAAAWCRETFDFAQFKALPKEPASGFAAERFDAVYAYSVFTHLPEHRHRAWLEELHRITKPGAAVVLTTMGQHALEDFANGGRPGLWPSAEVVSEDLEECQKTGFRFYPYEKLDWGEESNDEFFKSWDLGEYGSTFILPSYVEKNWLDLFDLVAIHEAPDDWQDYVVLKRR